jgi:hypothetical protein
MVANLRGPEPETSTFGSRYKETWLITLLYVWYWSIKCQQIQLSIQNPSTVTGSCDNTIGILVLVALFMKSFIFHHITTCSKLSFDFILVTYLGKSLRYISWISTGYIDILVDFQRAKSMNQFIFNMLQRYISSHSTNQTYISVHFQRVTSIHQLNFNGQHHSISRSSTGCIYVSVDFQKATSIYQLTFIALHRYINWRSMGCTDISVDFNGLQQYLN